ncbi:MAG: PEP-CTERM sorting domain-containing protein [Phycisphaerae bacterium]|jgi:hypothetical protein
MMKRNCIWSVGLAFLVAVLFFPIVAAGQLITIGWQVTGSGTQSGTVETDLDWDVINANPDTIYTWDLEDTIEVVLGPGNVAYIDGLSIGVKADPRITFGFSAAAGNSNTHFIFTSAVLPVSPALINAQGSASASVTFGDPADSLIGNYGGKAYRSIYNGSQIFADLVDTPAYYPSASGLAPSTPVSGAVTSMQAMWDVTVLAGGSASGSSRFTITGDMIPEPATMTLLGLGGLALLRKRN